ncbi:MAG: hypothetical protein AB7S48_15675 [Bacteroidales bacterium]
MSDKIDINESFKKSIQNKIENINIDLSEVVLDSFFDENILKEIPVIKSIISISKIGLDIKNYFLVNKLFKFLLELNSISVEDKKKFIAKLENEKYRKKIFNYLLILIDKIETEEKVIIMGKILKSMILEDINIDEGFRLFNIIEKAYYDDLLALANRYGNNRIKFRSDVYWSDEIKVNLNSLGLLSPIYNIDTSDVKRLPFGNVKIEIRDYEITKFGRLLVKFGF